VTYIDIYDALIYKVCRVIYDLSFCILSPIINNDTLYNITGRDTAMSQRTPEVLGTDVSVTGIVDPQTLSDYDPADVTIDEVVIDPSDPVEGEEVELELECTENSSGSGFVLAGFLVESDSLDSPILQKCKSIEKGTSFTIDDGDKGGALDGEFNVTDGMEIEVDVGNIDASGGYTCDVLPSYLLKTDETEFELNTQEPKPPISLNLSDVPEGGTLCPDDDFSFSVNITNSGKRGKYRLTLTNEDINQEVVREEVIEAAPSPNQPPFEYETVTESFTTRVAEGETRARVKLELEQYSFENFKWERADRDSIRIELSEPEIKIRNINSSSNICPDGSGTVSADLFTTSSCEVTGKAQLKNDFNSNTKESGTFTLTGSQDETVRFDFTVPANASDEIDYEVIAFSKKGAEFNDTGDAETTVNVVSPSIEFRQLTVTEDACVGENVTVSGVVANPGSCPQDVRLQVSNDYNDVTETIGPRGLEPQSNTQFSSEFTVPTSALSVDEIEYTVISQRELAGSWINSDDDSDSVEIGNAEFTSTDLELPQYAEPSELVESTVSFSNEGNCPGTLDISSNVGRNVSESLNPGTSLDYSFSFNMTAESKEVDITSRYSEISQVEQELTGLVKPHRLINVDTSNGSITITGGFDSTFTYDGIIIADNVAGDNLDEEDTVGGVLRLGLFSGVGDTDPSNYDALTFSSPQYINMRTDTPITWVVDGELQGKSTTFEYTSLSRNALLRPSDIPATDPDTRVVYNPIDRLGFLRSNLPGEQ